MSGGIWLRQIVFVFYIDGSRIEFPVKSILDSLLGGCRSLGSLSCGRVPCTGCGVLLRTSEDKDTAAYPSTIREDTIDYNAFPAN